MAKENKEWICSVCGYKFVGPEPPKECPVCHAKKSTSMRSAKSRKTFKLMTL